MSIALRIWKRGDRHGFLERVRVVKDQFSIRLGALALVAWLLVGMFLVYQTTIVNDSLSDLEKKELLAEKNTTYQHLQQVAQPQVIAIDIQAKHFPELRSHEFQLVYTMVNRTNQAIDSIIINLPPKNAYHFQLTANPSLYHVIKQDSTLGIYLLKLNKAMNINDSTQIHMFFHQRVLSFNDLAFNHQLLPNQSFFSSKDFPTVGMQSSHTTINYKLSLEVDKVYQPILSFPITQTVANQWEAKGESASGIAWYLLKNHQELNFQEGSKAGNVYFEHKYSQNAARALNTIKGFVQFLDKKSLPYPAPTISLVQQARGYEKQINSYLGLIGITETFGWNMATLEQGDFDYFSYYIAREIGKTFLKHQFKIDDVFLIDAFAEYIAYDFISNPSGSPLAYLQQRHNRYLTKRPKVTEQQISQLSASKNAIKGFFSLVGLSRHIGQKQFNKSFYSFIRHANRQELSLTVFHQYLKDSMPNTTHYYMDQALKEVLFYDNRIVSVSSEKQGEYYLNKIQINLKSIEATSSISDHENYELRLLGAEEKELSLISQSFSIGLNQIEVITKGKPILVVLDPFYTVMDLNRNNNQFINY